MYPHLIMYSKRDFGLRQNKVGRSCLPSKSVLATMHCFAVGSSEASCLLIDKSNEYARQRGRVLNCYAEATYYELMN